MKILVVGSGAREHALGWRLKIEASARDIFFDPGNGGTQEIGPTIAVGGDSSWVKKAQSVSADFVVFGSEAPLALGASDELRLSGFRVFGPSQSAARLESSKIFAKNFCRKHGLPTAQYGAFDNFREAFEFARKTPGPHVVKADGLAQGKGVVISSSLQETQDTLRSFLENGSLGESGKRLVIEEFLQGEEISQMAFFDGTNFVLLPPSRDYKRLQDGQNGPNTGGMGAFAPIELPISYYSALREEILRPFARALETEGIRYQGVIYFGLMATDQGLKILEFNVRFGDPETQALIPLIDVPLSDLMEACDSGFLKDFSEDIILKTLQRQNKKTVCVVLASKGYPQKPETGDVIEGNWVNRPNRGLLVFHAGTRREEDRLVTCGGRVLSVVGANASLEGARQIAYDAIKRIKFNAMQYRKDIGL